MDKASNRQIAEALLTLSNKIPQKQLAESLAAYLIIEKRTNDANSILRLLQKFRQEKQDIAEIDLISANPVNKIVEDQIKEMIDAKQVVVNKVIDSSVIGGVRLESNNEYLDLTVRSRLDRFKYSKIGV